MGKFTLINEFWLLLRQNKKLWMLPIVVVFVLLGILLVFAETSALGPAIYTVF